MTEESGSHPVVMRKENGRAQSGLSAEKQRNRRTVSDAFEDPSTEGFVDDDGLMTSQLQEGTGQLVFESHHE